MRFEYNSQMTMEILLRVGWLVGWGEAEYEGAKDEKSTRKKDNFSGT